MYSCSANRGLSEDQSHSLDDTFGTPTAAGTATFTAQVSDAQSRTAQKSFTIAVAPPEIPPQPAPAINNAKYKAGKRKLIVTGERIDANAVLSIDGAQAAARVDAGTMTAKPVTLNPGTHELRIINPSGVSSPPFSLTVE